MARVGKEIRAKIKSFENTKKITKAMEMVSASKMRKTQDRMRAARPYGDKIRNITANLAKANPEYRSPYHAQGRGLAQGGGLHRRHHRQGPVRWHEHQHPARGDAEDARRADRRRQGAGGGHRQQGARFPQPHRRQGGEPGHADRRPAAHGQADRPGDVDARSVRQRPGRRRVPVLHEVRQHDDAGAAGRAAAAAVGRAPAAKRERTLRVRAGTTSTSPRRGS